MPFSSQRRYVDAPYDASRILTNSDCGQGTVVCPASRCSIHSPGAPYGVRGSDPNLCSGLEALRGIL